MQDTPVKERKTRLERLRESLTETAAEIKRLEAEEANRQRQREAAENTRKRKADTVRKIEIGALALNHMRENQDTEFYRIMWRLLNRYVPKRRRQLFVEEFGIDPEPPHSPPANDSGNATLRTEFAGSS